MMRTTRASAQIQRFAPRRWAVPVLILVFLLAACGGGAPEVVGEQAMALGDGAQANDTAAVQPTPTPVAIASQVEDDTVQRLLGELSVGNEDLPADEAEAVTDELQDVLDELAGFRDEAETSEAALADELAKRLGGDFTADTDLDVLLAAVVDQLGVDPDATPDEVLAAIEGWANRGRIRIGGDPSGLARLVDLDPAQVLEVIDTEGLFLEALDGMAPIDLYRGDFDLAYTAETQTLTVAGDMAAPFHQRATLGVTWQTPSPTVYFAMARPQVSLAELLPDLGSATPTVTFDDVTLRISGDGVDVTGSFNPTQIAGYSTLGLPTGSLPLATTFPGLGSFGSAPTSGEMATTLDFDLGALTPYAAWNTSRTGQLQMQLSAQPAITYRETAVANLGGEALTFAGAVELGSEGAALALAMTDTWNAPFGATWLSISNVGLQVASGDTASATLRGDYALATKSGQIEMTIVDGADGATASASISVDSFGLQDLEALSQSVTGLSLTPNGLSLPGDLVNLRDVTIGATFAPNTPATFALSANTTVFGQSAEAIVGAVPAEAGGTALVTVVTPRDVSVASLVPALASDPIASSIRLPESAIVWTSSPISADSSALPPQMQTAFATAYGTASYALDLQPGLSLAGAIPAGIDGIDDVRAMLGMTGDDPIILSGTLPAAVFGGGGNVADLELRAMFPEITPSGGPSWLVSGQVGLRITGQPSIGIVGQLTMDLQGDIQTFEIEASIAKTPTGVAVSLTGRLGNPWQSPFGMNGLTLNEVVLSVGLNAQGSLTMGFLGDVVVGTKDIRGAISVAINPATGAPTNFAFEAQSEEGVGLGDLADLYSLMSGQARPPVEAVLPDIQFRGIDLRFAPQAVPDLGIEQGFKIAGELWLSPVPGAPVEKFVAVDLELSDQGIYAAGFLASLDLGEVRFSETKVELVVSASQQKFSLSGGAQVDALGGFDAKVAISKTEMSFGTTIVVGNGTAELEIGAGFDVRNPSFRVRAAMDEAFLTQVDALFAATLGVEITDIRANMAGYQKRIDDATALVKAGRSAYNAANKKRCVLGVCVRPCEIPGISNACKAANKKISQGERDLAAANAGMAEARKQLAKHEDIDLKIVGFEFETALEGFIDGAVSIDLIVDANGNRVPISASWDFSEPADKSMQLLVDSLLERYL